jgi:hypothetical protein
MKKIQDIMVEVALGCRGNFPPCLINSILLDEGEWGHGGIAPSFLISTLDGGERSTSRLIRFIRCEKGAMWAQSRPRRCEDENILSLQGLEPRSCDLQLGPYVSMRSLYNAQHSLLLANRRGDCCGMNL